MKHSQSETIHRKEGWLSGLQGQIYVRNSYLFPLSQSLPSGTQSSHTPPTKNGKGGGALYLIDITNCTTISSFNDTYPLSVHPEIQDPHDFNITLQMISPLCHFSLCCPLITPYNHHHNDHQSVSDPNSSAFLSFSSNITTDPCQFLPKIKMFPLEHIKLSSTNLLTKT